MVTIRLPDYETPCPPEKVLSIAMVDGRLFLQIEKANEGFEKESYEALASIGVESVDVVNAISALADSELVHAYRKKQDAK